MKPPTPIGSPESLLGRYSSEDGGLDAHEMWVLLNWLIAERDRAAKDKPVVVLPVAMVMGSHGLMYLRNEVKQALDKAGVAWEEQP